MADWARDPAALAERLSWYEHLAWIDTDTEAAVEEYWRRARFAEAFRNIVADLGPVDLWIANDWNTLPLCDLGRQRQGGVIHYDSHEFAAHEFAQNRIWRWFQAPLVRGIEGGLIRRCASASAVSPGIVKALGRKYRNAAPIMFVPNAPGYRRIEFRPCGDRIRLLYHGLIGPGRQLLELVDAVSGAQHDVHLTLRGPVTDPGFAAALDDRIGRASGRVTLAESVPMRDLVEAAADFDVGVIVLPRHSAHNQFALPNKLFEYMAAGLAVMANDLPEMAKVLRRSGCGPLVRGSDARAIRRTIEKLTPSKINAWKRASLSAAQTRWRWDRFGPAAIERMERQALTAHT